MWLKISRGFTVCFCSLFKLDHFLHPFLRKSGHTAVLLPVKTGRKLCQWDSAAALLLKTSTQVAGAHKAIAMRQDHEKEKPGRDKHSPAVLTYPVQPAPATTSSSRSLDELQGAAPSTCPHTKPPHSNIPGSGRTLSEHSELGDVQPLHPKRHSVHPESCSLPPAEPSSTLLLVLQDPASTQHPKVLPQRIDNNTRTLFESCFLPLAKSKMDRYLRVYTHNT